VQRLEIYANMYFFRILDVLKDDYPALLAVLGEPAFHNLVTDYLVHHPPAHFSLRHVGDRLPGFVATHAANATRPYLSELSRLECALNDAFDVADAPTVSVADLSALASGAWSGLRLRLHPSVQLLRGEWAVQALRERVDRGEVVADPVRTPTRLCVWRRDLEVFHHALGGDEFDALVLVAGGATFAEVCAAIAGEDDETAAAARAAAALAGWLDCGWVAAIESGF
jgi:hypothetical protein